MLRWFPAPDFYPTLLEAAGLPARPEQHRDGESFLTTVKTGKSDDGKTLFWHYPHYGNQGGAPGVAMLDGDWKLIEWFEDARAELFNLKDDPSERRNLSVDQPERVRSLRGRLVAWQKEMGALPTRPNPNFDSSISDGRR